ncbi:glycosyltransferase family 25 protein [Vibrio sp. ZSDE26]|uniref:Glycosyltransferase family 25 protein n=1 Tax=Vibrio amylolyticus TaxID=2847292 RepID=A0A9X2BGV3_9VIBR|nr:glycosyltransferase family 25 protein [Vibrio amylolyticus]MCK6263271.1 glycosyltransferase family 25 protein [Vibrio amylolyticus]
MIKTFVIHVSKGYEDRRKHIDSHLPERGITDYEYMLRGDIDDLSDDIRNHFFGESMSLPEKSCFYKHYLVMKRVVEEKIPQVLVLEDDALLEPDFLDQLSLISLELRKQSKYLVNIEEASSLVPVSIRVPKQKLYLCEVNKLAGGLIYDYSMAEAVVTYVESYTQDAPIDTTLGKLRHLLGYNLFWVHPPLVKQGSKSGLFDSELSGRKAGFYTAFRAWFKDNYKKHILSNLKAKHLAHFKNITKY